MDVRKDALRTDAKVNRVLIPICAAALSIYFIVGELTGWMPACMFHAITGFDCPGCGCQRAIHAAIDGRWWEAWSYNFILPFAGAYILLLLVLPALPTSRRVAKLYARLTSSTAGWISLSITILWWIVRNI